VQPWTTFQGNAAHTGYVPVTLDASHFRKGWEVVIKKGIPLNQITAADGKAFVTYGGGDLADMEFKVVSAASGQTLWSHTFQYTYSISPPAYDNGLLYLQVARAPGGELQIYGADLGDYVFWQPASVSEQGSLAPTIVEGEIYLAGDASVSAFADDHFLDWSMGLSTFEKWTPTVDFRYVYIYDYGRLNVLDRQNGEARYQIQDPNWDWKDHMQNRAIVLGGQHDALVVNGGRLLSFDLKARSVRWEKGLAIYSQPSVAEGHVYVVSEGALSVLREKDGKEQWKWKAPDDWLAGPLVVTSTHVFVSGDRKTYAVDLSTRQAAAEYPFAGTLSLSDGTLYIAGYKGRLVAIDLGTSGNDQRRDR
jgi:outer membrane protein assembly factor BamB